MPSIETLPLMVFEPNWTEAPRLSRKFYTDIEASNSGDESRYAARPTGQWGVDFKVDSFRVHARAKRVEQFILEHAKIGRAHV